MMAESTAAQHYQAARLQVDETEHRLRHLQSLSVFERSEQQEAEMGILEHRLAVMREVLPDLERAMVFAKQDVDIASVVAAWEPASAEMRAWYTDDFAVCVAALAACVERGKAKHRTLEKQTYALPEGIRRRLEFPGTGEWLDRMASRLPGWLGQALVALETLTIKDLQSAMDVDGGIVRLNPVMIERFQNERKVA